MSSPSLPDNSIPMTKPSKPVKKIEEDYTMYDEAKDDELEDIIEEDIEEDSENEA